MNAGLNRLVVVGTGALALLVAGSVSAAVSIGVPAGRPYFGSSNRADFRSMRSYLPTYSEPATESRQSFSYEPSEAGEQTAATSGGCCCGSHVAAPSESHDVAQKDPAKSDTTRQSFSYEPEASVGATSQETVSQGMMRRNTYRGMERRDAWQYQKTDPRRND